MLSIALAAALTLIAADPLAKANEHLARAQEAYKNKDYAAFVAGYEAAIAAGADHPTLLYNLACGYALLGKAEQAAAVLGRFADLGISADVEKDADFARVKDAP